MSALHTLGPWVVGRELNSERPGSIPIEAASRESLGGKMHVAFVNGKAGEQEANARLIAAAPALLAVCEEIERRLSSPLQIDYVPPSIVTSALAALRLARGS